MSLSDRSFVFVEKVWMPVESVLCAIFGTLNVLTPVVGGVWLVWAGDWWALFVVVLLAIAMPWWWSIVTLPSQGTTKLYIRLVGARRLNAAMTAGVVGALWDYVVMAAWAYGVYLMYMRMVHETSVVAYLLWGHATMITPLSYMANCEPEVSYAAGTGAFFSHMCYAYWVLSFYFDWSPTTSLVAIAVTGGYCITTLSLNAYVETLLRVEGIDQ